MCYSHVLLFNFRYSPYHYTNDFGFNTHDSDSKEVFPAITYDSSRPAMHLKTRLSDFLVFIVLTSVLFALPDMNNTQCIFFISCFYPSNALVEFVFMGTDNAFRPPHTII